MSCPATWGDGSSERQQQRGRGIGAGKRVPRKKVAGADCENGGMRRPDGSSKPGGLASVIERIDQALGELVELRSNTDLYWCRLADAKPEARAALLREVAVDVAAELYSRDADTA